MNWASQRAERIAIYVDGANAYFAQKEALGWWIDWQNFLNTLREGKDMVSAHWYQAYRVSPEGEQDKFLHHLTLIGFSVRKKLLKSVYDRISGGTTMKGNLDIELAIDALTECETYDTAILVTGDSDFVPLVEALRSRGKRVVVVATTQNVAIELRQSVGINFLDFKDLRSRIESDKRMTPREPEPIANGGGAAAAAPQRQRAYTPELVDEADQFDAEEGEEPAGEFYEDDEEFFANRPDPQSLELPKEGAIVRCRVQAVKKYGVFLDLHEHAKTLLHVKDMNRGFVPDAGEFYRVGEEIMVQIVSIDRNVTPPEVRVSVVAPETSEY